LQCVVKASAKGDSRLQLADDGKALCTSIDELHGHVTRDLHRNRSRLNDVRLKKILPCVFRARGWHARSRLDSHHGSEHFFFANAFLTFYASILAIKSDINGSQSNFHACTIETLRHYRRQQPMRPASF